MDIAIKLCECGCEQPAPIAMQHRPNARRGEPLRFIKGHNNRKAPGDDSWKEDFWRKADKDSDPNGCWLWTGPQTQGGYGLFMVRRVTNSFTKIASRLSYEMLVGEIPHGWTIDHVKERCTNILCVNPAHLEAVPHLINLLRGDTVNARNAAKTECHRGHPYTEENTYIDNRGWRSCRICMAINAENRANNL